ncbi:DksA/TraR family C4-type zinc finger protein [Sodalis endosymbiont of Spalangia cameroni]|uniref:DksA/TraR family C4-type zinc finger protein n=1 Tax=Sodalis praecaptivus TaxID=1239307 RepID=UPI0031F8EF3C
MASGWAPEGAVQDQIDATLNDAVQRVRQGLTGGASAQYCQECGDPIPEPRRAAVPGVQLCLTCQREQDKHRASYAGYNRRGSKDSQLR